MPAELHRKLLILEHLRYAENIAASLWMKMRFNRAIELADCKQEAFLGLVRAVDTFKPRKRHRATLRSWIYVKVKSTILDAVRRWKWFGQRFERRGQLEPRRMIFTPDIEFQVIKRKERIQKIRDFLDSLSPLSAPVLRRAGAF